ncbi:beta-ketoacyl-[acyl-carrier-protein] synthase family protein [Streptomyces sp. TR02-1]|uniref:beta-ketoacyl-[acyl-carrier-protein] synthase family protein n=1 Tax=Streptomyces sp. TR02-1 TaxID=3385977 RepID=UPI00399F06E7
MSERDVAVTGLGLVTPAGHGPEAFWDGLAACRSTAARDPRLAGLPVDLSCPVEDPDVAAVLGRRLAWRTDRFIHLALLAARDAVRDAALTPGEWEAPRVAVVIGTGNGGGDQQHRDHARLAAGRPGSVSPTSLPRSLPNMAAGEVSTDLQALGPSLSVSTACASGSTALGVARDLLRSGSCDIAVAGGTDTARAPVAAVGFAQLGALSRAHEPHAASRPFDADRDGFVLGEGAGMLVLERAEHARARRAPLRAYLAGYGAAADGHHHTDPSPHGEGLQRAMAAAVRDAGLDPFDVHHVNAHATSTRTGDRAEAHALRKFFGTPPPVTAVKSVTGHTLAASGAVEAAATVLALQHQHIPPTANLDRIDPEIDLDVVTTAPRPCRMTAALSNSCGFGGQNAALLFRAA